MFPNQPVLEQYPIEVGWKKTLFVDFVLPRLGLAFEVDGIQHFKFSRFFHGTKENFESQQHRDRVKSDWLESNNYTLIRFKYNESIDKKTLAEKVRESNRLRNR